MIESLTPGNIRELKLIESMTGLGPFKMLSFVVIRIVRDDDDV